MRSKSINENIAHRSVMTVSICLVLVIASLFTFHSSLNKVLRGSINNTLNQVVDGQKDSFKSVIDGYMYVLSSLSDYISKIDDGEERNNIIKSTITSGNFINISLYDKNGNGYDHLGTIHRLDDRRKIFDDAIKGYRAISKRKIGDTVQVIELAVPIYKNGVVDGVLIGDIEVSSIRNSFDTSRLNGDGYVIIVDSNTDVIIDPRLGGAKADDDLFIGYENPDIVGESTSKKIAEDMENGLEDTVHYKVGQAQRYVIYKKLGINDWYIFSVIGHDQISDVSESIMGYVYLMMLQVLIAVGLLVALIISNNKRRIELLEQKNKVIIKKQELLNGVYNDMPGGMIIGTVGECPKLKFVSNGTLEMFDCTEEQFRERFSENVRHIIYDKDRAECSAETDRQMSEGPEIRIHHRIETSAGEIKWVHNAGKVIKDNGGEGLFYCVLVDITDYKLAEIELRRSESKLNTISEQYIGVIFEIDLKKRRITHGESFRKIFGRNPILDNFPESAVQNGNVHPDDAEKFLEFYKPFTDAEPRHEVVRLMMANGEYLWCSITVSALFEEGEAYMAVGRITDIDDDIREKEELKIKAKRDSMTGLYNKAVTQEKIAEAMAEATDDLNQALMIIDLDNFKAVNDNYGHLTGDMVIAELATELKNMFRRSDIIGRVGGDEFVVFLPYLYDKADVIKKAEELCDIFSCRCMGEGGKCRVSISIGIAFTDTKILKYDDIFSHADKALYDAKQGGKNRYCIYSSDEQLENQLELV